MKYNLFWQRLRQWGLIFTTPLLSSGFNFSPAPAIKHNITDIQYVKRDRVTLSALWEREAMLPVPFVPLSIWPRSNIYVSLLNSSPFFPSWFLLSQSLTTFAPLYTIITARLSFSLFVSPRSVFATWPFLFPCCSISLFVLFHVLS